MRGYLKHKNMTEKILENFSIAQICESGQCFRMEEIQDGRYQVIAGDRYLELEQQGNRVRFDCTEDRKSVV